MPPAETPLALARREVHAAEGRVARQTALLRVLDQDGPAHEASMARQVLLGLQSGLARAREDLLIEQWIHDLRS